MRACGSETVMISVVHGSHRRSISYLSSPSRGAIIAKESRMMTIIPIQMNHNDRTT